MRKSLLLGTILLGSIRFTASAKALPPERIRCEGGDNGLVIVLERKSISDSGYVYHLMLGRDGQLAGLYESLGAPFQMLFGDMEEIKGFFAGQFRRPIGDRTRANGDVIKLSETDQFFIVYSDQNPSRGAGKFFRDNFNTISEAKALRQSMSDGTSQQDGRFGCSVELERIPH